MDPIEQFIPRQIEDKEQENILNVFSLGLDKVVDFGSKILLWDIESARGNDENLPIILSLRHFLDLLDSTSILIKKSSPDPAKLLLRGALETYLGLEYLFEKDTQKRCMAFLVWHAHKKIKTYKRLDLSTLQGKQLEKSIQKDQFLENFGIPSIQGLTEAINNLESLLNLPLYKEAEDEYQRLVSQGETNPSWYRLFNGPKKIEELASRVNLSSLYELLYREWSGPTHGTDIIQGKIFPNQLNTVDIVQIRYIKDAQSITGWGMILSLRAFESFLKNRLPEKENSYRQWYLTIKELFLRVTSKEQIITVE